MFFSVEAKQISTLVQQRATAIRDAVRRATVSLAGERKGQ
jgi:hypothetical protein